MLVVGKGDAHSLADRVRIFVLKRWYVGQKGFNALVHRFPRFDASEPSYRLRLGSGSLSIYQCGEGKSAIDSKLPVDVMQVKFDSSFGDI